MSFTIKCDKCGGEQVFTSESSLWEKNIEIDVDTNSGYLGTTIHSVDIYCQNMDCPNQIEIIHR